MHFLVTVQIHSMMWKMQSEKQHLRAFHHIPTVETTDAIKDGQGARLIWTKFDTCASFRLHFPVLKFNDLFRY